MKTSNRILLAGLSLTVVAILILLLMVKKIAGGSYDNLADNQLIVKTYDIQPFSSLRVVGAIEVEYFVDTVPSLFIEYFSNDADKLTVNIGEDLLEIKLVNSHGKKAKCRLAAPAFTNLDATAGSKFRNDSLLVTEQFNVTANAGASVNVKGTFQKVVVESNAGSSVQLEGQASFAVFEANAGASIKGKEFTIDETQATANAGATILVNTGKLSAESNAGATIKYNQGAIINNISTGAGGSIKSY